MKPKELFKIYDEISIEINNQIQKWGIQNHPSLDQTLLNRKGGCTPLRMCQEYQIPSEIIAKQKCDNAFIKGEGTYAHIALEEFAEVVSEFDPVKRRQELVQLAAVCVSWIGSMDRNEIPI